MLIEFSFIRHFFFACVILLFIIIWGIITFSPIECTGCELTATAYDVTCFDNNTPNDDSDDTWAFKITATNPKAVLSQWRGRIGNNEYVGMYGTPLTISNLPYGSDVSMVICDDVKRLCYKYVTVSPPTEKCSSKKCKLSYIVLSKRCNDNNTPYNEKDDTWSFDIQAYNSDSKSSKWKMIIGKQVYVGDYGIVKRIANLPLDKSISTSISDDTNPNCAKKVEVLPPECTVEEKKCHIVLNVFNRQMETRSLKTAKDDTWLIQFIVEGHNMSKNGWTGTLGGKPISGEYNMIKTMYKLPLGTPLVLTVVDKENSKCNQTQSVIPPKSYTPTSPKPIPGKPEGSYCDKIAPCFDTDRFNVAQLVGQHVLAFFDSADDPRHKRGIAFEYYEKKWTKIQLIDDVDCKDRKLKVAELPRNADSLRVTHYVSNIPSVNIARSITFKVKNNKIVCDSPKRSLIENWHNQ